MFCFNCGKNLPEGSKFCFYCGNEQPEYVPFAALKKAAPAPIIQPEYVAPEPVVQPEPVVIPEPIVVKEPTPVVVPEPIVEEPAPVVVPEPIVEEPAPVVVPEPIVVEEPAPAVIPEPVVEEPAPVVIPEPIVEEPAPVVVPEPIVEEPAPAYPVPTPVAETVAEPKKKKEKKKKEKKSSKKSGRGGVVLLIVLCVILAVLTAVVGIGYAQRIRANDKIAVDIPMAEETPATLEAAPEAVAEPEAVAPIMALPVPDYFFGVVDAQNADVNSRDFSWYVEGDPTIYPHIYLEFICGGYGMEIFEERENGDGMEFVVGAEDMVYATFGWRESKPEIYFHYEDFVPLAPTEVGPEPLPFLVDEANAVHPEFHEVTTFLDIPEIIGVEPITPISDCFAEAYDVSYLEDGFARAMGYAQVLAEDSTLPVTLEYYEAWDVSGAALHVFSFRAKEGFDMPDAGFVFEQGEEQTVSPCGAIVVIVEERVDGGAILHVAYSTSLTPVDMGARFDPNSENPYLQ